MQSPARGNGFCGITRLLRPPVLRLQQVHIPAPRDIERMPVAANQLLLDLLERFPAVPYGAEKPLNSLDGIPSPYGR
jgi:hypothetical protein